jgi:hypothetical protein
MDVVAAGYVGTIQQGFHPGSMAVHEFVTAKYLGGTPAHWDFFTPLFLDGRVIAGANVFMAASGTVAALFAGAGADGDVVKFAGTTPYLPYPKLR